MFTGIIEHVGRIESLERNADGGRLRVHAGALAASLAVSGSVAVNGCCLTVVELAGETFAADLSAETLRRTAFSEMKPGARVNLERPLAAGKGLGGHFVQGHVDGIGRVAPLPPPRPFPADDRAPGRRRILDAQAETLCGHCVRRIRVKTESRRRLRMLRRWNCQDSPSTHSVTSSAGINASCRRKFRRKGSLAFSN